MAFWLIVITILIALLVYWLYEPLPPGTANPIKYRLIAAITIVLDDVTRLQSWWRGVDYRIVDQQNLLWFAMIGRQGHPDVKVTEDEFDGIHVYIYQKHGSRNNRAGLIYYHGGGFRFGHPVAYEGIIRKFVLKFDMLVVAPVYRLAPQVKVPVPHEDCKRATDYFFLNAEKYGVNPKCIGAAGDSAGGNLAASMCQVLRDQKKYQFAYQVLIYPWLQALDEQTPSKQRNCPTAARFMTHDALSSYVGSAVGADVKLFPQISANKHVTPETWERYKKYMNIDDIPPEGIPATYSPVRPTDVNRKLADDIEKDLTNPVVFPLLVDNLSNLPPAHVITAENDPVRDDGIWYAKRLERSGNKVVHHHSPDGFHGMVGFVEPPLVFDSAIRGIESINSFIEDIIN